MTVKKKKTIAKKEPLSINEKILQALEINNSALHDVTLRLTQIRNIESLMLEATKFELLKNSNQVNREYMLEYEAKVNNHSPLGDWKFFPKSEKMEKKEE